jgi:hypothetical protein
VSYYDATNRDLKYAKWDGDSWIIETVDSPEGVVIRLFPDVSLALDSLNRPHIAYSLSYYGLMYAHLVNHISIPNLLALLITVGSMVIVLGGGAFLWKKGFLKKFIEGRKILIKGLPRTVEVITLKRELAARQPPTDIISHSSI